MSFDYDRNVNLVCDELGCEVLDCMWFRYCGSVENV